MESSKPLLPLCEEDPWDAMKDENNFGSDTQAHAVSTQQSHQKYFLYATLVLLLASVTGNVLLIWKSDSIISSAPHGSLSSTYETPLGRDTRYMTLNHTSDELWEPLLEDRLGEFSTPADEFERGEYSMFHQLRCLARFRLTIQRAAAGQDVGVDFRDDHWAHCLDYMRRIVLCNADDSVERPRIALPQPDGSVRYGIEGAEELRVCRSIQPMCDRLAEAGLAETSCIENLDSTLNPWPGLDTRR